MQDKQVFLPGDWFVEFEQDYGDGVRVAKRGLEASPLVAKKYAIDADEVLAFSNYDGPNRGMTVFHFHPDFSEERRRRYMEAHREGYDIAQETTRHMAAVKARQRAAMWQKLSKPRRAVAAAAHAAALFFLTAYTTGR